MKRIFSLFLAVIMLFALCACSSYHTSYSATMLLRSEERNHCEVDFGSLAGTLVMDAKVKADPEVDGTIHYEAELREGELSVYYDINGAKELLFTIKGGEKVDSRGGKVSVGDKVTFIIETVGTAKNGEIELDFD